MEKSTHSEVKEEEARKLKIKVKSMPGENCCIPGCGSCRNTKGLGFFKLPILRNGEKNGWM